MTLGWFQLYPVQYAIELLNDEHYRKEFPHYFFFGSDGGLEQVALDLSQPEPFPVVIIDPIDGPESAIEIAPDMASLTKALGHKSAEDHLAALLKAFGRNSQEGRS